MLKTFKKNKLFFFDAMYNTSNFNFLNIYPDYSSKKQLLNNYIFFRKIMDDSNSLFFIKRTQKGNNVVVLDSVFNKNTDTNIFKKLENNFLREEKKEHIFSLKNFNEKKTSSGLNINFFINFNVHFLINIELYKILIFLHLYKLFQ